MVTCMCFDVGMGARVVLSPGEGAWVGQWAGHVRERGRENIKIYIYKNATVSLILIVHAYYFFKGVIFRKIDLSAT